MLQRLEMSSSREGTRQESSLREITRQEITLQEITVALLLALAVLFLYLANAALPPTQPGEAPPDRPGDQLDLGFQAQYELGIRQLLGGEIFSQAAGNEADQIVEASSRRLENLARTPRERIALVPVHLHLSNQGATGQFDAMDSSLAQLAALADDESLDAEIRAEAEIFHGLLRQPPLRPAPEQRDRIVATYGFFARLALEPESTLVEARRTALVLYLLAAAGLLVFFLGVCAAILLLYRSSRGRLRSAYRERELRRAALGESVPAAARLPYLETTLIFLIAVTVVGGLIGYAMGLTSDGSAEPGTGGPGHWLLLLNWSVVAVPFWPLVRGHSWPELRRALGWHRGRGLLVEIGCGLFAYLAAMPLLALGLALTLLLTRFTAQPPHHPIVDWLQDSGTGGIVVVIILAVVWAPLVEESLFRGGFYHYLRGRLGVAGSVLLVSIVFAAIHPQGLAGIPFLATLAVVLGLTREWRDSVVASITLHMLHNSLATLLLLVLVS